MKGKDTELKEELAKYLFNLICGGGAKDDWDSSSLGRKLFYRREAARMIVLVRKARWLSPEEVRHKGNEIRWYCRPTRMTPEGIK